MIRYGMGDVYFKEAALCIPRKEWITITQEEESINGIINQCRSLPSSGSLLTQAPSSSSALLPKHSLCGAEYDCHIQNLLYE